MANTIVEMKSKEGVLLKTKNTYCEEDIEVKVGFTIPKLAQIQFGVSNEILYELAGTYSGQRVEVNTDIANGEEIKNKEYSLDYLQTYIKDNKIPLSLHINTPVNLQRKVVEPTTYTQVVRANNAYDGLAQVTIPAVQLQSRKFTANGEYTADDGFLGFSRVIVDVADSVGELTEATVTPTKARQEILPAAYGVDGFSKVIVSAIPDSYVEPTGSKTISENGVFDIAGLATVTVDLKLPSEHRVIKTLKDGKYFDVEYDKTLYIDIDTYEGLTEDL